MPIRQPHSPCCPGYPPYATRPLCAPCHNVSCLAACLISAFLLPRSLPPFARCTPTPTPTPQHPACCSSHVLGLPPVAHALARLPAAPHTPSAPLTTLARTHFQSPTSMSPCLSCVHPSLLCQRVLPPTTRKVRKLFPFYFT